MSWVDIFLKLLPWIILGLYIAFVILTKKNWKQKLAEVAAKVIECAKDGNLTLDEIIGIIEWALKNNPSEQEIKEKVAVTLLLKKEKYI